MKNHHSPELYVDGKYIPNPDYILGCNSTHLIQRLNMPRENDNGAWCFGGGLQRGGLTEKAWGLVSPLCSFDFMGSAEFEFGALPKAFHKVAAAQGNLEAYPLTVSGHPEFIMMGKLREYQYHALQRIRKKHMLEATVFVLTPHNLRPHVDDVILSLAVEDEGSLKESSHLRDALFFSPSWSDQDEDEWLRRITRGWLEFDNGFMFFSDEDMWRGFCELFGVSVPEVHEVKPVCPDFSKVNKALESCPKHEKAAA